MIIKCPNCYEEIDTTKNTLDKIRFLLSVKSMNISELCSALKIKRSTLIYFLNQLEIRREVEKERVLSGVTGRPTYYLLKKEVRKAFAPENHQWLLAFDNQSKGGKYVK